MKRWSQHRAIIIIKCLHIGRKNVVTCNSVTECVFFSQLVTVFTFGYYTTGIYFIESSYTIESFGVSVLDSNGTLL